MTDKSKVMRNEKHTLDQYLHLLLHYMKIKLVNDFLRESEDKESLIVEIRRIVL